MKFCQIVGRIFLIFLIAWGLTTSVLPQDDLTEKTRRHTLMIEFDYLTWTMKAVTQKAGQFQVGASHHIPLEMQLHLVLRYFDLIRQLEETQAIIQIVYAEPGIKTPEIAAENYLTFQKEIEASLNTLAPIAEEILQQQVSEVLEENGIAVIETTFPPVLFETSALPKALIVSPRGSIQQEVNISLLADLSLENISALEDRVESALNVSALVVDVGGIGVYPTMVERTSNFQWTIDTIAHEWAHNYLTLHPLGWNYETSPELRTMNETTASIVGTEVSTQVIQRYYSGLFGATSPQKTLWKPANQEFDFRHEMHLTRVKVDELLSEGNVEIAEEYMEARRVVFVQHGYIIRKLNQAYFAFHGAYADTPGGAAGEDPVGPAVWLLRAQSESLAAFLREIAGMNSFTDLQAAVQ